MPTSESQVGQADRASRWRAWRTSGRTSRCRCVTRSWAPSTASAGCAITSSATSRGAGMRRLLSELLETPTVDADGAAVGFVRDVRLAQDGPYVEGFGHALRV